MGNHLSIKSFSKRNLVNSVLPETLYFRKNFILVNYDYGIGIILNAIIII